MPAKSGSQEEKRVEAKSSSQTSPSKTNSRVSVRPSSCRLNLDYAIVTIFSPILWVKGTGHFQKPELPKPYPYRRLSRPPFHLRVQGWLIIGKSDASVDISRSDVADI